MINKLKMYRIARGVRAIDVVTVLRRAGWRVDSAKLSRIESGQYQVDAVKEEMIKKAIERLEAK